MAVVEYYVATDGTNDLAAGRGESSGDPWLTPEYAVDTGIPNTGQGAGGDRLNIAAGTYTLTANLGGLGYFTSFSPGFNKPFYFRGDTAANTILDGDASFSIYASAKNYVGFLNLTLRNSGSNKIIDMADFSAIIHCILHNTSSYWVICKIQCLLAGNEFYDASGAFGILTDSFGHIDGNYFHGTTNAPNFICYLQDSVGTFTNNVVQMFSGQNITAITLVGPQGVASNNSIFSVGSTGRGIDINRGRAINNLIEGFSGAGGVGIGTAAGAQWSPMMVNNAVYNCTTAYTTRGLQSGSTVEWCFYDDNETLSASPFTDAPNGDFTPVDTDNVKEGGWPSFTVPFGSQQSFPWKGAIQPQAAAAGGGILIGLGTSGGARN